MNWIKKSFLVLIIYILKCHCAFGQGLYWKISSDSLYYIESQTNYSKDKVFKSYKEIIQYRDSIKNTLYKKGFITALVGKTTKKNDSCFVTQITLGKAYKHIQLTPVDTTTDSLMKSTLSRKQKHTYPIEQLDQQLQNIRDQLNNQGYNMTQVSTVQHVFKDSDTLQTKIKITTGQLRRIDRIEIRGYTKHPKPLLALVARKKYIANHTNIEKINKKISAAGLSNITKTSELLFKKDSTILYTYLERKNTNTIDGLIGFNTTSQGKVELNGYLDLTLHNNLNQGERLHLLYRGDIEDQTRLEIAAKIPYLFNSRIGLQGELKITRRDSTYQNNTTSIGSFYSISPNSNIGLNYLSHESNEGSNEQDNVAQFNYKGWSAQYQYTQIDDQDLFQPQQLAINTNISTGTRTSSLSKNHQIKINATFLKNWHLFTKSSVTLTGRLHYLDTNELLFNELFQVGGTNSIRGFNQNSIDTNFMTALNSEYRYQITPSLEVNGLIDVGIVEDFTTRKNKTIYSLGIGSNILTKTGILKIYLANGFFKGANIDLSSTVAHVNMIIKF